MQNHLSSSNSAKATTTKPKRLSPCQIALLPSYPCLCLHHHHHLHHHCLGVRNSRCSSSTRTSSGRTCSTTVLGTCEGAWYAWASSPAHVKASPANTAAAADCSACFLFALFLSRERRDVQLLRGRFRTAPILTLFIPGTPLKTTPLQKRA